MRKHILLILILSLIFMLVSCAEEELPAEVAVPALKVSGAKLTDGNGNPVSLRGMSSHGLGWYPRYINASALQTLKEYGANVIRLALYSETKAGYLEEPYSLDMLYIGVENAIAEDMYVIVDWHILSDGNPLTHADDAEEFFSEVSRRYANLPNVLYEICNEPNGETDWDDVTEYANRIIPAIRENSPDAVILVGTPKYSTQIQEAMKAPLPFDNLMYSCHKYVDVSPGGKKPSVYWLEKAIEYRFPVFVTEWGITYGKDFPDNPDDKATLEEQYGNLDMERARSFVDFLNENGISWCGWALSNSVEIHAAIRWDCDKLHGWTMEDLTPGGELMFSAIKGRAEQ